MFCVSFRLDRIHHRLRVPSDSPENMGKEDKLEEKFDGKNFNCWARRMANLLVEKDLDEVVGIDPTTLALSTESPLRMAKTTDRPAGNIINRADLKARAKIVNRCTDSVLNLIDNRTITSAHDLWKRLQCHYSRKTPAATVKAFRVLAAMRKSPGESCQAYISKVKDAVHEFGEASNTTLNDTVCAAVIFAGLPDEYGSVTAAADSDQNALSAERISGMILNREIELSGGRAKEHVIRANAINKETCSHCKNGGRSVKKHKSSSSWFKFPEKRPSTNKPVVSLYLSSVSGDCEAKMPTKTIIDSGAECHAIKDQHCFKNYRSLAGSLVKAYAANGQAITISGEGKCELDFGDHKTEIDNCVHVPDIEYNLLSVGESTSKGISFFFIDKFCDVADKGGRIIAKIKKENDLYPWKSQTLTANQLQLKEQTILATVSKFLIHCRNGHIRGKLLEDLRKVLDDAAHDNDNHDLVKSCPSCVKAKMTRTPFP